MIEFAIGVALAGADVAPDAVFRAAWRSYYDCVNDAIKSHVRPEGLTLQEVNTEVDHALVACASSRRTAVEIADEALKQDPRYPTAPSRAKAIQDAFARFEQSLRPQPVSSSSDGKAETHAQN